MTLFTASPEDKPFWCAQGERDEQAFVRFVAPAHGLAATINPRKQLDPHVPDLLVNGQLADLKTQRTPFFTAGRYDLDPQFAVTLNVIDLERYRRLGADFPLYFWIRWDTLQARFSGTTYMVRPLEGVWRTTVADVLELVHAGRVARHVYRNRIADTSGNAKESYVLDLGWMTHLPYVLDKAACAARRPPTAAGAAGGRPVLYAHSRIRQVRLLDSPSTQ